MGEAVQGLHEAVRRAIESRALPNCPATLMTLARGEAIKAIKDEMRARGEKVWSISRGSVVRAANEYLDGHPELVEVAAEIVRKAPKLRTLAEKEARERGRKPR